MSFFSLSNKHKTWLAGLFLTVFILSPMGVGAATLFEQLQTLQQQVNALLSVINSSQEISEEERASLTGQLTDVSDQIGQIQIALGDNANIRTNVESLQISGNVNAMTATAQVVYNPEIINGESLPTATSTYTYTFETSYPTHAKKYRARQLKLLAAAAIVEDTGLPSRYVRNEGVYSFKIFRDADEVGDFINDHDGDVNDLVDLFGVYSVVERIDFYAGDSVGANDLTVVTLTTDQGDMLNLGIGPSKYSCGGGEQDCFRAPPWDYSVKLTTEGVVLTVIEIEDAQRGGIRDQLRAMFRESGVGQILVPTTTDEQLVDSLVPLLLDQTTYYFLKNRLFASGNSSEVIGNRSSVSDVDPDMPTNGCYDEGNREVLVDLAEFVIKDNLQLAASIDELFYWNVPTITGESDSPETTGCKNVSDYFFDVEANGGGPLENSPFNL